MRAVVVLATGFEEIEAIVPIDLLRRSGIKVMVCGLDSLTVFGANNVCLQADMLLNDLTEAFSALILPGGSLGAQNLAQSSIIHRLLKDSCQKGLLIGAICASPAVVLGGLGLLKGKRFTCYPGLESLIQDGFFCDQSVVQDGCFITSRGIGTVVDFSYQLISGLLGEEEAQKVFQKALLPYPVVS